MLDRGLSVSRHLAQRGAPVTRPTEKPESGPHRVDDSCVTFWQYESTIDSEVDITQAVNALNRVHRELPHYSGDLPHFWKSLDQTYQQLQTPDSRRFLSEGDHCFLKEVFKRFQHLKSLSEDVLRPLHGACHLGNVINTERGHLWLDFDNVCLGPIEWDLSCLPEEAIGDRDIDRAIMHDLRMLRRWVTAVWCWMIYDRSSEKREAAEYHLAILKRHYQETRS